MEYKPDKVVVELLGREWRWADYSGKELTELTLKYGFED